MNFAGQERLLIQLSSSAAFLQWVLMYRIALIVFQSVWQTTTLTGLQRPPPDSYSAETSNKLQTVHLRLYTQKLSSRAVSEMRVEHAVSSQEWMEFFKEDGDINKEE